MTPDQVKIVQQSFVKVAPISDQAAVIFYDRLFEVAPQVKAMFPADMTEQRKKLMATLAFVVNGLGNLESILPAASALATYSSSWPGGVVTFCHSAPARSASASARRRCRVKSRARASSPVQRSVS